MRNVLVTGGVGFIGSNFVRFLLDRESDLTVVNLDALTYAGNKDNLAGLPNPDHHHFVEGNICDRDLVISTMRRYQIDTVVHFAAETHVDRSILGPAPFVETNVAGTFTLLDSARGLWLEEDIQEGHPVRFHHISTDEVYGSLAAGDPAWNEASPYDPHSPYAASKAASDHLVRSYGHTYGLPYTLTNCSNNYGPFQFPEKLIPVMLLNALSGQPLPLYGDGKQIRDWLYVTDHCRAIWQVLVQGSSGETYHVSGGNQPTNLALVIGLCSILDDVRPESPHIPHRRLITFVEDRPGHDRRYAMDAGKNQSELVWEPRVSLEEGLRKTVDWYLEHPEWVRVVQKKGKYRDWVRENYQNRKKEE